MTKSTRDLATKAKYFAAAVHRRGGGGDILGGRGVADRQMGGGDVGEGSSQGLIQSEQLRAPTLLRAFIKGNEVRSVN